MMKQFLTALSLVSLGVVAFGVPAFAYTTEPASSLYQAKKTYTQNLNEAIQRRWYNYYKDKIRDNDYKNVYSQLERHRDSKYNSNVNERSTQPRREGELRNVPNYEEIREMSKRRVDAVNTQKRNFRRRAIDYYVDGGDADAEVLEQGIRSSEHRVQRIPDSYFNRGLYDSDIKSRIRNIQRFIGQPEKVGAGQQRQRSYRRGDSSREFMHPFMGQ